MLVHRTSSQLLSAVTRTPSRYLATRVALLHTRPRTSNHIRAVKPIPFLRVPAESTRSLSSTIPRSTTDSAANKSHKKGVAPVPPVPRPELTFESSEPRLSLTFTCTVPECHTRSTHQFTKRSYEKGIVLVECPGCKNRHLIADHLGWFKESTEEGTLKTVEDLVRAKGEKVRRGRIDTGGVIEYTPE